jgi:hypothetical protein
MAKLSKRGVRFRLGGVHLEFARTSNHNLILKMAYGEDSSWSRETIFGSGAGSIGLFLSDNPIGNLFSTGLYYQIATVILYGQR